MYSKMYGKWRINLRMYGEMKEMSNYYSKQLSSNLLKQCYDIAPMRVQQYLEAETDYVLEHIITADIVLELGCGYGRVLKKFLRSSSEVIGIDTSRESLLLATEFTQRNPRCHLIQANASRLPFPNDSIDKVVCIQNGISAFKLDSEKLILECVRVTKEGGFCLFSSYSPNFWEHRLEWFKLQADANLIGEIDWDKTKDGIISCKDGFKATTFTQEDFTVLTTLLDLNADIVEVDNSSVFCVITV
jgi:2-polyprenyl-6-hydroxyphenyl methylase/3-demethylubiquinone-9 3-methyltransferase